MSFFNHRRQELTREVVPIIAADLKSGCLVVCVPHVPQQSILTSTPFRHYQVMTMSQSVLSMPAIPHNLILKTSSLVMYPSLGIPLSSLLFSPL